MEKRKYVPKISRDKLCAAVSGVAVTWNDIETYLDETFYSVLERWYYTKLWGLANGKGWGNEPIDYVESISILESEQNAIEAEAMEKQRADMENKKPKGKR